jgi:hypothetical protein
MPFQSQSPCLDHSNISEDIAAECLPFLLSTQKFTVRNETKVSTALTGFTFLNLNHENISTV